MIKINLATRKAAAALTNSGAGGAPKVLGAGIGRIDFRLDGIKDYPVKKIAVLLAAALIADYLVGTWNDEELAKAEATIAKQTEDQGRLQQELEKTRGYEEIKKEIDADELSMKVKIETIQQLIVDRQTPPKMLMSISTAIPKDVWLTAFKIEADKVQFDGRATSLSPVTDFMKNLNESAYFIDVDAKAGNMKDEVTGAEVAVFTLTAKRR